MRLKKIRLAGFKSFVEPTTIPFPGDMTAIVGPNGCGKSNVIDAVRWVLGESSAKNLRGDAMTDVIFNGSSARKPVGQCSVELVFDNDSGRIAGEYASFNELSVKRLVTRDGQSTYFLNNSRCRRKDVTDLFLGTGLGPRSYAIIEQGMISRLIESRPQDLRVFLEEAAGVSRYKERRRETENRIRHTRDNLARLDDVRGELTTQLEKLEKQAATAQKFKTLKARERQLKAELSALRWSQFNDKVRDLRQRQQRQQVSVDELQARLRSHEAGHTGQHTRQQELKEQLDTLQQQQFTTRTEITRIEQADLHRQQRLQQLEQEIAEYVQRRQRWEQQQSEARQHQSEASQKVTELTPDVELLQARLLQSQENEQSSEDALHQFSEQTQRVDSSFQEARHTHQRLQSQLQAEDAIARRTQTRITQIQHELEELQQQDVATDVRKAEAEVDLLKARTEETKAQAHQAKMVYEENQHQHQQAVEEVKTCDTEVQKLHSQMAALTTLSQARQPAVSDIPVSPLWQHLKVSPRWQQAAQAVLALMHDPVLYEGAGSPTLAEYHTLPAQNVMVFAGAFTDSSTAGTLAAQLESDSLIPSLFNQILVAEDIEQALPRLQDLAADQMLVTCTGVLLTRQWAYQFGEDDGQGALQIASQLSQCEERIQQQQQNLDDAVARRQYCQQLKETSEEHYQSLTQQVQHLALELKQQQHKLELAVQNQQQYEQRLHKFSTEREELYELLGKEQQTIATLEAGIKEAEQREQQLKEERLVHHQQHERLTREYREARHHTQQYQQQLHSRQLSLQQQQQYQQRYQEESQRLDQQLEECAERLLQLSREKEELLQPKAAGKKDLERLLQDKSAIDTQMQQLTTEIGNVQARLHDADKHRDELNEMIRQQQHQVDTLVIDIESARARADAVLEQLDQRQTPLGPLLEQLPADATEKSWQRTLDATIQAVNQLGAVNLAAVEEYEVQAQRQAHLNSQYDDLTEALETLQSAIRKIDKETRQRFADTFEQVNKDLQALFPKVFGGGAAYLELTDTDLLEAGVTIMARPPGKKNSTIHLLSGGEKALTALSLVFAIFRLNPAPFCLLDEVDAPLDDANVGRFCNLVSQMSGSVQFIYITHNKIAMEMATHLTGVTMAEPGVSRMVAVDVDEAMAFVEA